MNESRKESLRLRPAKVVMDLDRLGSLHPYRLSFMRILLRHVMNERWNIQQAIFELDDNGYGTAIYSIDGQHGRFSFVVFAHYLDPENRSDRVIANQWDMTATLCEGDVTEAHLEMLRANVPLQEAGRVDSRSIVLSRANKSSRNFDYVIDMLSSGQQPSSEQIARVGYLYRTTAVYGSGKFGMADWKKVQKMHPDFARPFAAEMFACYMIRHFSLQQAEHVAFARAPSSAVGLDKEVKRYFGIGNATGLGMAPYLINHPQLIGCWLQARETALARVTQKTKATDEHRSKLQKLLGKAIQHLTEIDTGNKHQARINTESIKELKQVSEWLRSQNEPEWSDLLMKTTAAWTAETQEIVNSLLIEMYPELVDDLEDELCIDETIELVPDQSLGDLRTLIEKHYTWALQIDFDDAASRGVFWYRSLEKAEPRLGTTGEDPGEEWAMSVAIAHDVRQCYDQVCAHLETHGEATTAEFALRYPGLRRTLRRIQTMSQQMYGDIQANLTDSDVLPIHLLRCKLSFFGVSKFDPKSRLWVRNTMFQGAPLVEEIGEPFADDWYFPTMPMAHTGGQH